MELLAEVGRARHLFDSAHLALVVEAVIAGSFRATVWVDDPAAPRTALLWDGSHGIYLVGAVDRPEEWRGLLAREVLPAGRGIFKADVSDAVAATVLPGRRLDRRARLFYAPAAPDKSTRPDKSTQPDKSGHEPDLSNGGTGEGRTAATDLSAGRGATNGPELSVGGSATNGTDLSAGRGATNGPELSTVGAARGERDLPAEGPSPGIRVSEINECLDELVGLANAADVVAEIESMWPSLDAFRRGGFGFVAHDDSTIAGWCTAEYVSPGRCGIGIETVTAFRRRGIATATARAFLAHCATLGLTPHWDAWTSNRPSIAVAERIGLHLVETYHVHVGEFGEGS